MRRRYIVEVNADPTWGWNDHDHPHDMQKGIERILEAVHPHYRPTVTYDGVVEDGYHAAWAGYGSDGNDQNGHMHLHPDGTHTRSDGRRGFFCMAPTKDGHCTDPHPRYLQALHEHDQEQASA